jgi:hypothetical protein
MKKRKQNRKIKRKREENGKLAPGLNPYRPAHSSFSQARGPNFISPRALSLRQAGPLGRCTLTVWLLCGPIG